MQVESRTISSRWPKLFSTNARSTIADCFTASCSRSSTGAVLWLTPAAKSFMSLSQSGFESRGLSSPIWRGRGGRRCLCRFRLLIIHDQTRTALSGQEQPAPLQEHADPKTELRQKSDMDESPCQPREKIMFVNFAALQDAVP